MITLVSIYCLLVVILTLIGGVIPIAKHWDDHYLRVFISFASGILIGVFFIHILPETIELIGTKAGIFTLIGFLVIFIIEKFIMVHPCEGSDCHFHTIGIASFVGLSIHGLISGIIIGTSVTVDVIKFIVIFAIIIHKMPESFSLATLLKKSNYSNKKIFWLLLLFSSFVPIGAFSSLFFLKLTSHDYIGYILALSGGTFIYLGASDLLPEVHRESEYRHMNLVSFLLGILLMAISGYIVP